MAQTTQPQPDTASDIIVTGKNRQKQVRDFVKALTPAASSGILPRFIDQVCPYATGLLPVQNERIVARVRYVAHLAGLDVAKPGCHPNAFIIVTPSKREFIMGLAKRANNAFALMSYAEVRHLAKSPGPAAAWQLAGPVDTAGNPLRWDEDLNAYANYSKEPASRLRSPTHTGFDASVVVVESGSLEGLTATQLADYAALRLFIRMDPARLPPGAPPTILNILEAPMGSAVPITMTAWDAGLLRGLYLSTANLRAQSERSQIAGTIDKELGADRR